MAENPLTDLQVEVLPVFFSLLAGSLAPRGSLTSSMLASCCSLSTGTRS
jgi:hypothetical protein